MFSATVYAVLENIIGRHLIDPVFVSTKTHVDKSKLRQVYYDIHNPNMKFSLLVHLLKNSTSGPALVFCATRHESDFVARNLRSQGLNASAIHGGMSQDKREKSLDSLKNDRTDILVATDVAARGLDMRNVTHVYNYDVPKTPKEYIHRIGRTARAGEMGDAVTLLTQRDHDNFRRIRTDEELDIKCEPMPDFNRITFDRGFGRGGRMDGRSGGGGRDRFHRPSGRSGRPGRYSGHDSWR
jgi:ATP-dependent RNA helicase DeaD